MGDCHAPQKGSLKSGEAGFTKLLAQAETILGAENPTVKMGYAIMIGIAEGKIYGRHLQTRLQAARELLDRALGKAVQPLIHSGSKDEPLEVTYRVSYSDGSNATPPNAAQRAIVQGATHALEATQEPDDTDPDEDS